MRKAMSIHLFLFLAMILAGTGQVLAYTDPVLRGDANGDGYVNVTDASIVINKFHNISNPSNPINADANGDGYINVTDASIIINMFHYGSVKGNGTIEGWIEGNEGEELTEHPLEPGSDSEPDEGD